ncbi:Imm50 family immunity protein [Streptomyces sp. NPDC050145]|uniref:Imm50 family immunity protein n=1 Tax=Streptomyces sp. NPDC050145 TaxID=3365602 RepID=UPI00378A9FA5
MRWTSLLHNPEGITAVYQGTPPDLRSVRLHEAALMTEGPTLKLRLDLPAYPARPPRKWADQKFNTVQVEISFSGLHSISLTGFATDITADVSLTEGEAGITVNVASPVFRLQANSTTALISRVTAYADEHGGPGADAPGPRTTA